MDNVDKLIAELIDAGALEPEGMLGDEFTYRFDMKILKDQFPEIYDVLIEEMDEELLQLFEEGIMNIEYDENLEVMFSLTEKGRAYAESLMLGDEDD